MPHNLPYMINRNGSFVFDRRVTKDRQADFGQSVVRLDLGRDESGAPYLVIRAPGATYIPQAISRPFRRPSCISDAIAAPRVAVTQTQRIGLSTAFHDLSRPTC